MSRHVVDVLVGNSDGAIPIKREVSVVFNNTNSSLYTASDNYKALTMIFSEEIAIRSTIVQKL